jgi:hypothetical protein
MAPCILGCFDLFHLAKELNLNSGYVCGLLSAPGPNINSFVELYIQGVPGQMGH